MSSSPRSSDALMSCTPPQPRHPQPARALFSHDRPRSSFKRVSTSLFVSRSPPESFPSSCKHNHHQIGQIRISESRIGPKNSSAALQVPLSFLLFCLSSLSNDNVLRKAFRGTLPVASVGITGSLLELEFTSASVKDLPDLARTCATMLTGAGEYLSRKTGHFAC